MVKKPQNTGIVKKVNNKLPKIIFRDIKTG